MFPSDYNFLGDRCKRFLNNIVQCISPGTYKAWLLAKVTTSITALNPSPKLFYSHGYTLQILRFVARVLFFDHQCCIHKRFLNEAEGWKKLVWKRLSLLWWNFLILVSTTLYKTSTTVSCFKGQLSDTVLPLFPLYCNKTEQTNCLSKAWKNTQKWVGCKCRVMTGLKSCCNSISQNYYK